MTKTLPMTVRLMAVGACVVAFSIPLSAQDHSRYRDYRIGDDLQAIAEQSGLVPPIAPIIAREPLGLQEMEWRPQYSRGATQGSEAVARLTFGFYDDQLFRIVVDYERLRTEGMTEADMVEAISETYGPPSRRVVAAAAVTERTGEGADFLVAVWEDADYSVTLLRVPDSVAFRMIVASTRLATLAQAAGAGAVRFDLHDAPSPDVPARSSQDEDGRSIQHKARLANKAAFKP
jgi:hypothetical protein